MSSLEKSKNKCTFCGAESSECTVGFINNNRSEVSYKGIEKSNEAKIYICDKQDCSIKYRQALNEVDYL